MFLFLFYSCRAIFGCNVSAPRKISLIKWWKIPLLNKRRVQINARSTISSFTQTPLAFNQENTVHRTAILRSIVISCFKLSDNASKKQECHRKKCGLYMQFFFAIEHLGSQQAVSSHRSIWYRCPLSVRILYTAFLSPDFKSHPFSDAHKKTKNSRLLFEKTW